MLKEIIVATLAVASIQVACEQTLIIITPRACARGKVIGLSIYCRRCRQHENGPIWTFSPFYVL